MSSEEEEAKEIEDAGEEEGIDSDDPCRSQEDEKELLFLIEFLVDTMLLKPENMKLEDIDPCLLQGPTCVVLTFLHYPPMSICETDVDPCRRTGGTYIKFNSGKSLMFALSESQFENPPPIYLNVVAYKNLPHGSVPNKLQIGVTKICLTELFKQVFEKVEAKPDKLPLSKSIKDNYQLIGVKKNCPPGEITIYIRLSCLGQNVVTEFQRGNDECDPYLFKSKESKKVYECTPKDLPGGDEAEDLCPPLPGWGLVSGKDCGDGGADQTAVKPRSTTFGDGFGYRGGDFPNDDDEYDEFETEVHGHALTIKVQKSQKKQDDYAGQASDGNQISFQVPQDQKFCNRGKNNNKATVYNINAAEKNACGAKPLQIIHGEDTPDNDVFLLKIGKKGEANANGKLELELRTPKPRIERPVNQIKKFDKGVQTEKEEVPKKGKKKAK